MFDNNLEAGQKTGSAPKVLRGSEAMPKTGPAQKIDDGDSTETVHDGEEAGKKTGPAQNHHVGEEAGSKTGTAQKDDDGVTGVVLQGTGVDVVYS